jgi:hypothetical protein
VCDSDAVDHEAYGTEYENSKLMDYKAGHDAGFAAVCTLFSARGLACALLMCVISSRMVVVQ